MMRRNYRTLYYSFRPATQCRYFSTSTLAACGHQTSGSGNFNNTNNYTSRTGTTANTTANNKTTGKSGQSEGSWSKTNSESGMYGSFQKSESGQSVGTEASWGKPSGMNTSFSGNTPSSSNTSGYNSFASASNFGGPTTATTGATTNFSETSGNSPSAAGKYSSFGESTNSFGNRDMNSNTGSNFGKYGNEGSSSAYGRSSDARADADRSNFEGIKRGNINDSTSSWNSRKGSQTEWGKTESRATDLGGNTNLSGQSGSTNSMGLGSNPTAAAGGFGNFGKESSTSSFKTGESSRNDWSSNRNTDASSPSANNFKPSSTSSGSTFGDMNTNLGNNFGNRDMNSNTGNLGRSEYESNLRNPAGTNHRNVSTPPSAFTAPSIYPENISLEENALTKGERENFTSTKSSGTPFASTRSTDATSRSSDATNKNTMNDLGKTGRGTGGPNY